MLRCGITGGLVHVLAISLMLVASAVAGSGARAAEAALDLAVTRAQRLVAPANTVVLAAAASQEGHWTFANLKGERFTAATPDEMKRVASILAPEVATAGAKLLLVVTEASVFAGEDALAKLPRDTVLQLSTQIGVYALTDTKPRRVRLSPRIEVEVVERAAFDEVLLQLDRPLGGSGLRILSLEPGAPTALSPRAAFDDKSKGEIIERIDPPRLKEAIGALRGQTALVTGRLDGRLLYFQVAGGPDRSVIAADLMEAARSADVNLIILDAPAGRQPGARNWLWQRAAVKGVDAGLADRRLEGLLEALSSDARPLSLKLTDATGDRVTLLAMEIGAAAPSVGGIGERLARVASDLTNTVTGRIEPAAIHLHLVSTSRQRELDRRLVRWLPSWASWGYLGLLLIGSAGARASWRWWSRIWPPEQATEYPGQLGLQLARGVRLLLYVALFMPLTALAAVPVAVLQRR